MTSEAITHWGAAALIWGVAFGLWAVLLALFKAQIVWLLNQPRDWWWDQHGKHQLVGYFLKHGNPPIGLVNHFKLKAELSSIVTTENDDA